MRFAILLLCVVLIPSGCEKDKSHASSGPPPSTQPVRTGTATIRGTVTLVGRPPVMATIPNKPCHEGAGPLKDESVVTDGSGHLQNVVVYLEDAPPAPTATDLPPVTLDQKDCRYVPHVLALRTGQTLHVTTSDPAIHNVHGMCTANEPFNFALVRPGQSKDLTFDQPEVFLVRCDVHPWMKAYIHILSHPYFAVTRGDGTFEIANAPAGQYTLVAWQENYGTLKRHVKLSEDQTTTTGFAYHSGH